MTVIIARAVVTSLLLAGATAVAAWWARWRFPRRVSTRLARSFVAIGALMALASALVTLASPGTQTDWMLGAHEISLVVFGTLLSWIACVLALEAALASPRLTRSLLRRWSRAKAPTDPPLDDRGAARREAIAKIGAGVLSGVGTATVAWGSLHTRLDVEVVEVPIRLARLPRVLDGFSIVQLSDIHIGPFFGEARLREVEDVVRRLKPDLIAMTGDLVDVQPRYFPVGAAFLARLSPIARHGVFAIPGNHEHYAGAQAFEEALTRAGIDVMINRGRRIAPGDGGGFALVGVDDVSSLDHRRGPGPLVAGALSSLPPDRARVLLCHQPSYLATAAANRFDLMLSGHTHGGQIAVVGQALVRSLFRNYAGLGALAGTQIYVNRGLGTSGPPVRVGIRPEITKLVLVSG